MPEQPTVAHPPKRPLLIYDGDCGFCRAWIRRWRQMTGDRVDYAISQDFAITSLYPEIPAERYKSSVQLILPDGRVLYGAEAVLTALATNPRRTFPLWLYR